MLHRFFSTKVETIKPESLSHLPKAEITTLPNGLRVASEKIPKNNHTATVSICINAGSRYETPENNGCAHFLEHLAFKGTAKRSREQLEKEVENMGGHLNAFTSREETHYVSSVMKDDIPQAMDILADITLNSKLSKECVENERSTILEESKQVYKDLEEYVFDFLHETAYLNNPLGMTILGPEKNIKSLSRQDIQYYIKTHYTPERMVIAASGAVDHGQLVRLATEKFGALKPAPANKNTTFLPAQYIGGEYRERQDEAEMVNMAIAFETCGWKDADTFPLLVMHSLLGSWDKADLHGQHSNSRLVATVSAYRDTGLFGIFCTAYEGRLYEISNAIMTAFRELSDHVSDAQVDEVRNRLATASLLETESSARVCEDLGRQVLNYGRKMSAAEFVARLNAVDAEAVRAAARRFLYDKDLTVAAVGPVVEMPPYKWFRRRTYSLVN